MRQRCAVSAYSVNQSFESVKCVKMSNYLVLESQFSNDQAKAVYCSSVYQCYSCVALCAVRPGRGCKQFPLVFFQRGAVRRGGGTLFCERQTTSHSQTSVCCCRSVQNSLDNTDEMRHIGPKKRILISKPRTSSMQSGIQPKRCLRFSRALYI